MATIQQRVAQHWRDREIARSETISDAWQVFLAYSGRSAEIILFICMAMSLVQMIPGIMLPDPLTGAVFVVQMITLDVAGFGLTSLAKAVGRMGDAETARKAGTIGTCLIIIMFTSMIVGGVSRLFGPNHPDVKTWAGYIDDVLILIRIGMTVLYGKIMHSLRDSQQHMQQTEEDEQAALREEITRLQTTLHNERDSSRDAQAKLTTQIDSTKSEQAEKINELSQHLAEVKAALETRNAELSHLQNHLSSIEPQLDKERAKASKLQMELDTLRTQKLSSQVSNGGQKLDNIRSFVDAKSTKKVSSVDSEQDKKQLVRELLKEEPGLSGRAIAQRLNCSPTTANKLKADIEEEQKVS